MPSFEHGSVQRQTRLTKSLHPRTSQFSWVGTKQNTHTHIHVNTALNGNICYGKVSRSWDVLEWTVSMHSPIFSLCTCLGCKWRPWYRSNYAKLHLLGWAFIPDCGAEKGNRANAVSPPGDQSDPKPRGGSALCITSSPPFKRTARCVCV